MPAPEPHLSALAQERSRETRKKLMRAAATLWQRKGFDDSTVSDVCDLAGVSKGTFYFYFPHKEDLLVELGLLTATRAFAAAQASLALDRTTEEVLRDSVASIAARVERTDKRLLARTLVELYQRIGEWDTVRGDRPGFGHTFELVFERARRNGELATGQDPFELASMLTIAILSGMMAWAKGRIGAADLEAVLWRSTLLILDGAERDRVPGVRHPG